MRMRDSSPWYSIHRHLGGRSAERHRDPSPDHLWEAQFLESFEEEGPRKRVKRYYKKKVLNF
jgi:hypothetical protein